MSRMQASILAGGKRLHLNDGPIDLVIGADGAPAAVQSAFAAARCRFETILDELCGELELLRQKTGRIPEGIIARRMWQATSPMADEHFITPMAAVAGAVAEEVLGAMKAAANLARAYVNNGGDVALHLVEGQSFRLGLVDRPDRPSLFANATINWHDSVRGIATSGWRGRSFSLGIADAVTALAETASAADAAATIIANAVDLPGHPGVSRIAADSLQPDSDLGPLPVTRGVGMLTRTEIETALERGVVTAQRLARQGLIIAAALHLAGITRTLGTTPIAREGSIALYA
jgi:ApbE superfamily uncharacterized protein (UPF0280 family)